MLRTNEQLLQGEKSIKINLNLILSLFFVAARSLVNSMPLQPAQTVQSATRGSGGGNRAASNRMVAFSPSRAKSANVQRSMVAIAPDSYLNGDNFEVGYPE